MLSSTIGWKTLELTCRSLSTMLESGIDIRKAFDIAARRTSDARAAHALKGISVGINQGQDVSEAMREQHPAFPELVVDMVSMAEQTGALPEVLRGLADHYENNVRMRRTFLQQIAWPMLQLIAAVLIIALVIWVLGMIPQANENARDGGNPDMLGLGLRGERGAMIWLGGFAMLAIAGTFLFLLLKKSLAARMVVDPFLMKIPVVGNCLRAFAIARFSWAYYLTQQTGMPIHKSLASSLRATGNGAFIARSRGICEAVKSGENLGDALDASELFPEEYVHTVHVAESSGTVPETLNRLSPQFEDQARRSLGVLTTALGWAIWAMVAGFIIFLIFRIFSNYIKLIQNFAT